MKVLNVNKVANWFTAESDSVNHSFPSIYTKDDVNKLLSKLKDSILEESEEPIVGVFDNDKINEIAEGIFIELENEGTDIVDDYDLSMSYREVELDRIDLNKRVIMKIIVNVIDNYITQPTEE
jgi:hypothetical protein